MATKQAFLVFPAAHTQVAGDPKTHDPRRPPHALQATGADERTEKIVLNCKKKIKNCKILTGKFQILKFDFLRLPAVVVVVVVVVGAAVVVLVVVGAGVVVVALVVVVVVGAAVVVVVVGAAVVVVVVGARVVVVVVVGAGVVVVVVVKTVVEVVLVVRLELTYLQKLSCRSLQ
jgi:hypothetical protein